MNKKWIWVIAVTIALSFSTLAVTSMAKPDPTPKEAVTLFYEHANKGEIEESKEYIASEVIDYFENGNGFHGTLTHGINREAEQYNKVTPIKENINGDTAIVTSSVTYPDDSKGKVEMHLIKESDGWKLTFQ